MGHNLKQSHQNFTQSRTPNYRYVITSVAALIGILTFYHYQSVFLNDRLATPSTSHTHIYNDDVPFPSGTEVGYPGPTPTGLEPALAKVAYPLQQDVFPLVRPHAKDSNITSTFDITKSWGNLSPFYSVSQDFPGGSSVKDASPAIPSYCKLTQVHVLHRHGARYPTSYGGPQNFALKLARLPYRATGDLSFLNTWNYVLGAEILTPFGRNQLFQLGVGMRQKYGSLLPSLDDRKKLVFRSTTQDRMHKSALNFAAGFFGIPYEDQYHQLLMVEANGFNCTLAPYKTCTHAEDRVSRLYERPMQEWMGVYLKAARERLQDMLEGVELSIQDTFDIQTICPYEVVALGASPFCSLFTEEEWRGFDYAWDLYFWYNNGWGAPTSAAVGLGWVQELLSRLTQEPLTTFNSTTNSTLHNPQLFPLDQPITVDATHDTVIPPILTALNFTFLALSGPLPSTYIPKERSFVTTRISPFAANLHAQVLKCTRDNGGEEEKIRFILNDAVLPSTGLRGCEEDPEGLCSLEIVVDMLKERIGEIDFAHDCHGDYHYHTNITTGRPPFPS